MAKKQSIEELVTEQAETETVEQVETLETPKTHTVTYGETYPSIAEMYKGKESNNSYAKKLKALNANKHLTSGTVLTLP